MNECVILLHGMGRTKRSMRRLERLLSGHGYRTVNLAYPSLSLTIEEIADAHLGPVVARCRQEGCGRIHFIAHSLGGIVVRRFLQTHEVPCGSRVVMLAPPNQGSELADILSSFFFYRRFMGPAAQQIGTSPDSLPNRLGPALIETGVITGARGLVPFASWIFQGPNDGKVSVERARLAGMRDFLVMPCGHSFIMRNPAVLFQVVHFLQHGRFSRP